MRSFLGNRVYVISENLEMFKNLKEMFRSYTIDHFRQLYKINKGKTKHQKPITKMIIPILDDSKCFASFPQNFKLIFYFWLLKNDILFLNYIKIPFT